MNEQWNTIAGVLAQNRPLFEALGDAHRQEIIIRLAEEKKLTVGELATEIGLSRPATSHHIKILKEAGLLQETRQGTKRYYYPTFTAHTDSLAELLRAITA